MAWLPPLLLCLASAQGFGPPSRFPPVPVNELLKGAKILAPTMDEEEELSMIMPEKYRCDACKAVMFQLDGALRAKQPRERRLKQWEYTDVFDEACDHESFKGYGLTRVLGVNQLSGPGIKKQDPDTKNIGHMQLNSESWSKRLGQECRSAVFERIGEDATYDIFYARYAAEQKGAGAASSESGLTEKVCMQRLGQCTDKRTPVPVRAVKVKKSAKKAGDEPRGFPEPAGRLHYLAKAVPRPPGVMRVLVGVAKAAAKPADQPPGAAKPAAKKAGGSATKAPAPADTGENLDVEGFFERFATKSGGSASDYVAPRSEAAWEQAILAMASGLFSQQQSK